MNAQPTMEAALKHALTLLDHFPVAVTLGTHLTMMEHLAMVCTKRKISYPYIVCPSSLCFGASIKLVYLANQM